MKTIPLLFLTILTTLSVFADDKVYLVVRTDDMGSSHAANLACLDVYTKGIATAVEVMPVCPWFLEAAEMLNEHPDYDVGIHLALTSEWSLYKWRPITHAPSLVDDDGYFFPMVWKNSNFPPYSSLSEADWDIEEIEAELRAQIELGLKYIPHVTHMNSHMGFSNYDPQIRALMERLAEEYELYLDHYNSDELKRFRGWENPKSLMDQVNQFCENLEKLTPGYYIMVVHAAYANPEMEPIGHIGYTDVAQERDWETHTLMHPKVLQKIRELDIELISYRR